MVFEAIKEAIGEDITTINDDIKQFQAKQATAREAAKPSASEMRARRTCDFVSGNPVDQGLDSLTADERSQLEQNWRGLAATLRREDETEEQAFERVKYIEVPHSRFGTTSIGRLPCGAPIRSG